MLREEEDVFYLRFQEVLHDVARTNQVDDELIRQRKDAFRSYEALKPPRVLTSDGEAVAGTYRRDDLPSGALVGLPVSAGTVEGRARVILDIAKADLEPGDILVTAYTDPSLDALFGRDQRPGDDGGRRGPMTHGAVIAREYGLPAVARGRARHPGLIRDGERIRVHGTDGYVEILRELAQRRPRMLTIRLCSTRTRTQRGLGPARIAVDARAALEQRRGSSPDHERASPETRTASRGATHRGDGPLADRDLRARRVRARGIRGALSAGISGRRSSRRSRRRGAARAGARSTSPPASRCRRASPIRPAW